MAQEGYFYRYINLKNGDMLKRYDTGQSVMVLKSEGKNVTVSTPYNNFKIGETYTYAQLHQIFWLYKRYKPKNPKPGTWKPGMSRSQYSRNYQAYRKLEKKFKNYVTN